ncbi:glycosyltransferase family 2 protein [uncultured Psychroserpens sp.]|uniref:glycosyltransferase family 2 protein n=1 Tax=uncultured Psychroserpens sp. TaxID=255436 RepID=UPI00261D706F|nr:glycosyltransferase family 2 protein [uncultured Psychroserpens sp.]
MVSVIIPNYNRSQYLKQALQSVMDQTYSNWEALVIDDGSTDDSKTIVNEFAITDSRIVWLERKNKLKGASVCRNIGINNAKGTYVVFLDSDDLLAPHCLQQRTQFMKTNPDLDFSVFKMQFFVEAIGDDDRLWNLKTNENELQRFLNLDSVWQTTGPIWKTQALKKIGGFNPELECWQDIDIHLKALSSNLNYQLCYSLPVDCYYRKNSTGSISQVHTNSLSKLESKRKLYYWLNERFDSSDFNIKQIPLHILISAINGHQKRFYKQFYGQVISLFSKQDQKRVRQMARINFYRLNKLQRFERRFSELKNSLIKHSSIGKFKINDA